MDDAGLVRLDEPGDDGARDAQHPRHRQLAVALQNRREVGAIDVRHRDVLDAVDLAEVVNADDVLVRHLTREQQLALEAPLDFRSRRRIRHHLRTDHFDRDGNAQLRVPGLVHRAHAADAEQTNDVIAGAERLADHQRAFLLGSWIRRPRRRTSGRARPRGKRQPSINDGRRKRSGHQDGGVRVVALRGRRRQGRHI